MAFASRAFFLLCGIIGLTGVVSPNLTSSSLSLIAVFIIVNHLFLSSPQWSLPVQDDTDECCPKGWTQLDKRCFIYQKNARTFTDAESICNLLGGNLASILSALEYATVLQVIKLKEDPIDDTWIGLHEALEADTFLWTDGSDFDFSAFNADNDAGDCVEIESSDELWDNETCDSDNPFVCARDSKCKH
ncbi:galactose-specific lectin nattectin-like [Nerophis lumbriciformis]|uniref:galactose-specific lectin nattectin-like n=1 Tax=Nerophis lumbriciformis TaxID=546530 RepID=UPI003BA8C224